MIINKYINDPLIISNENNNMTGMIKIVSILAILALGFLILSFFLWLINRKRLFNIWGVIIASFGAGFGFSWTAFLWTFLDVYSKNWNLAQRLSVGLEVFLWSFGASIIIIPIAIAMTKARKR